MGMGDLERDEGGRWPERLVTELGRAAHAGWWPTIRLIALLVVVAGAVVLVIIASK